MLDEQRISMAIANVLDNAINYTKKGSIKISLDNQNHKWIALIIKDTGVGLSKDKITEIITGGVAPELSERKYTGLNLGLLLTRLVVSAHKGKLLIDSQEGKGTKITILLPKKVGMVNEQ
jgi:signal transduction histidine kinase